MSLTTLPSELILAISSRIHPDTIEAYGRTCHRIRTIATPFIREHRQLLAKYIKPSLTTATAADLLYAIASRPWIKLYPQSVELTAIKDRKSSAIPSDANSRWMKAELDAKRDTLDENDIMDMISGTELFAAHEIEEWVNGLANADEDYTFAILIAVLPNLNRLIINSHGKKLENMKEVIRRIKNKAGDRRALVNLKSVRVKEQGRADACDLELFPMLAGLSGVTDLEGENLVGMYRECYRDGWLSYPGASSTITHLSLKHCGMSAEGLEMLMRSLKHLQSFAYTCHRARWGLHAIADNVLKGARSSLRTLEISALDGGARYVGSLRSLVALRELTVDTDMLLRQGKLQRAVDILPASIEKVTLSGNNLTLPLQRRFLADLYRPAYTYPNLRSIAIDDSFGRREIAKGLLTFQREYNRKTSDYWVKSFS